MRTSYASTAQRLHIVYMTRRKAATLHKEDLDAEQHYGDGHQKDCE